MAQEHTNSDPEHVHQTHPSVAALNARGVVSDLSNKIELSDSVEVEKVAPAKRNRIRESRAALFFSRSSIGYEVQRDTTLFEDKDLKVPVEELFAGEILGGSTPLSDGLFAVDVVEPFEGFVPASDVLSFDIADAKWKFRLTHISQPTMISLPDVNVSPASSPKKRRNVTFANNTVIDEEKMDIIPNEIEQEPLPLEEILEDQEEKLNKILRIPPQDQTTRQIIELFTYALNLKKSEVLVRAYHPDAQVQIFEHPMVAGRANIATLLDRLFEASGDFYCKFLMPSDFYEITSTSFLVQYEVLSAGMSTSSVAFQDSFVYAVVGVNKETGTISKQCIRRHPALSNLSYFYRTNSSRSNRSWSTAVNADSTTGFQSLSTLNEFDEFVGDSWQTGLFWALVLALFVAVFPRWLRQYTAWNVRWW